MAIADLAQKWLQYSTGASALFFCTQVTDAKAQVDRRYCGRVFLSPQKRLALTDEKRKSSMLLVGMIQGWF